MDNWNYIGSANFGSDSGVSLRGLSFDEVLAIVSLSNFDVYRGVSPGSYQLVLSNPSFSFYWIPQQGAAQLTQTLVQGITSYSISNLMITMQFTPTSVNTSKVLAISHRNGSATNLNTASSGHIDVYYR